MSNVGVGSRHAYGYLLSLSGSEHRRLSCDPTLQDTTRVGGWEESYTAEPEAWAGNGPGIREGEGRRGGEGVASAD